ncbi:hydrolase [Moraxella caviae]|uniref:Hydrolase n=1 Tax=Moraxella caviae TaxID=34060 RepID=A0A1T0A5F9_9GAMM|nr:TatD family hydrolase [Moraxella caviae]OOR90910.1 hydrolase [Moraxella caviae]STZ10205.1 Uncharacterized deoxyribonuclease YjjV [Moraxella caviae]
MPLLIDTHTHFDVPEYADERQQYAKRAWEKGVRHLVLIGFLAKYFEQMASVQRQMSAWQDVPQAHCAVGLHPLYIREHSDDDLTLVDRYLASTNSVAIAEIGLDTYDKTLASDEYFTKQQKFFIEQIHLAKTHDLPILLHIRKAHADVLKILKQTRYQAHEQGGIAHSFSGGENEALAFVKMGFKLGITGQITNPNAKKLRNAVLAVFKKFGASAFVIETDCPDMMPVPCQIDGNHFNEPANLPYVLHELASIFAMPPDELAPILWENSNEALRQTWAMRD